MESLNISKYKPNETTIQFPSGEKKVYPHPVTVSDILKDIPTEKDNILVGCNVDGELRNLAYTIPGHFSTVEPVYITSNSGRSLYKRTLCYIFMMAASIELKEQKLATIEHAISHGYFIWCNSGESSFTEDETKRILARMREIIKADLPIVPTEMSRAEAIEYFSQRLRPYTLELIKSNNNSTVKVNTCGGYSDIYVRCLAHTTGQFDVFDLISVPKYNGIVLLFSSPKDPKKVADYCENKDICAVYKEWNKIGETLNISCTGELNRAILAGRSKKVISLDEALQNKKMAELADAINKRKDQVKLILIAGPSSSGKTTFAAKLSLQLEIFGIKPLVLTVDNYYKPHDECPRDANGKFDFEVIDALRIDKLNQDLVSLLSGKETETPIFDFKTGRAKAETRRMKVPEHGVIVMEGIHCLNAELTPLVKRENKFQIFIAPLSQVNLDETNFVSNTVNRLARRIVRDYRTRGYSALDTITRWPAVVAAEETFIFPFMKEADAIFNTACNYELSVLKDHATPLLKSVTPEMPMYNTVREMLNLFEFFHAAQDDTVPPDSLVREFIGGSFFGAV